MPPGRDVLRLHGEPADASAPPVVLSPFLRFSSLSFSLTDDSARVVFVAAGADRRPRAWSAPTDGSTAPVEISQPVTPSLLVDDDLQLSHDGRMVYFRAEPDVFGDLGPELYRVPSRGGRAPERIELDPAGFPRVLSFALSPDGKQVLHRTSRADVIELFATRLGSGPRARRR